MGICGNHRIFIRRAAGFLRRGKYIARFAARIILLYGAGSCAEGVYRLENDNKKKTPKLRIGRVGKPS